MSMNVCSVKSVSKCVTLVQSGGTGGSVSQESAPPFRAEWDLGGVIRPCCSKFLPLDEGLCREAEGLSVPADVG